MDRINFIVPSSLTWEVQNLENAQETDNDCFVQHYFLCKKLLHTEVTIKKLPYRCAQAVGRPKICTFSHIKLLFCPFVLQGKGIICGYEEKIGCYLAGILSGIGRSVGQKRALIRKKVRILGRPTWHYYPQSIYVMQNCPRQIQ